MGGSFTNGDDAIMTASTFTDYLIMIHLRRWYPGSIRVARLTNIATVNMCCQIFARSISSVMAGYTGVSESRMIKVNI